MKCRADYINGQRACRFCGSKCSRKVGKTLKDLLIVCVFGAAWGFLIAWGVGL